MQRAYRLFRKKGALLTVLWHNNRFNENEYPGQARVYEKIIEESMKRGAWVATGKDILEWWDNGGQTSR